MVDKNVHICAAKILKKSKKVGNKMNHRETRRNQVSERKAIEVS